MWPFPGKSIAHVYVDEIKAKLDHGVVPLFPPDGRVEVGAFGTFKAGQFVRRGSVTERGVDFGTPARGETAPFEFASNGKIDIGPTVEVPGAGAPLVATTITSTRKHAVVASFQRGVQEAVKDADAFAESVLALWRDQELLADRVVVWSVRKARGGTVIVAREAGAKVDVMVDAAVAAGASIGLPTLAAGVRFGGESTASYTLSAADTEVVTELRLLRLRRGAASDAYAFERGDAQALAEASADAFTADDLLAELKEERAPPGG